MRAGDAYEILKVTHQASTLTAAFGSPFSCAKGPEVGSGRSAGENTRGC